MSSVHVSKVLAKLIEISVKARHAPGRRVERFVKTIGKRHPRLSVIVGKKERRAANVTERSLGSEMRRYRAGVIQPRVALVVMELDGKARIDGRLVGIGQRTVHIVEVEAHKKLALVGNAMVNAHGKLVRVRRDFGGGGVGARSKGPLRIVGQG